MSMNKLLLQAIMVVAFLATFNSCSTNASKQKNEKTDKIVYPSDVFSNMDKFTILLGDGTRSKNVVNFQKKDYFYVENDGKDNWVVYKAPNAGITSKTSKNTRSELGERRRWIPEEGGKLGATLKIMHVSTSGNPKKGSAYSVVVGQIHSAEGFKNEPLKIFYKKFPGHKKGSVFWNYEINTKGDNAKRWDYSTPVWGYDMYTVSSDTSSYPDEPKDGIKLGETFSYEVNVYNGVMYLSFTSAGHDTVKFTKSLIKSEFATKENVPEIIKEKYYSKGRDGVERDTAYAGEKIFFKQGAYNQTNPKNGGATFGRDIEKQYNNGAYVELWFKEASLGKGTKPNEN